MAHCFVHDRGSMTIIAHIGDRADTLVIVPQRVRKRLHIVTRSVTFCTGF